MTKHPTPRSVFSKALYGLLFAIALVASGVVSAQLACPSITGYRDVVLRGVERDALAGAAVYGLGDINGDGRGDYAIGAPEATFEGRIWAGRLYVRYGDPSQQSMDLPEPAASNPDSASGGFVIGGNGALSQVPLAGWGGVVTALGDVDGDGVGDFILGATGGVISPDTAPGAVYLFYGRRAEGDTPAFPAVIDLAAVPSGVYGDQIRRLGFAGSSLVDTFGYAVTALGDINGDGLRDFAIGMPGTDNPAINFGSVLIYLGNAARPQNPAPRTILHGTPVHGNFGSGILGDFDFDADGRRDFIACAPNESNGATFTGACYLIWGTHLANLVNAGVEFSVNRLRPTEGGDGSLGVVLDGGVVNAGLGWQSTIQGRVDLNGDGHPDLVFGSYSFSPGPMETQTGRVWVLYGGRRPSFVNLTMSTLANATPGPSQFGFVLDPPPLRQLHFGMRLSGPFDVNGDGRGDLLIGAPSLNCVGNPCGRVFAIHGRGLGGANGFLPTTPVTDASLVAGLGTAFGPLVTPTTRSWFGSAVTTITDFSGDGKPELLVGDPVARFNGAQRGGACLYIGAGAPVAVPTSTPFSGVLIALLLLIAGIIGLMRLRSA